MIRRSQCIVNTAEHIKGTGLGYLALSCCLKQFQFRLCSTSKADVTAVNENTQRKRTAASDSSPSAPLRFVDKSQPKVSQVEDDDRRSFASTGFIHSNTASSSQGNTRTERDQQTHFTGEDAGQQVRRSVYALDSTASTRVRLEEEALERKLANNSTFFIGFRKMYRMMAFKMMGIFPEVLFRVDDAVTKRSSFGDGRKSGNNDDATDDSYNAYGTSQRAEDQQQQQQSSTQYREHAKSWKEVREEEKAEKKRIRERISKLGGDSLFR